MPADIRMIPLQCSAMNMTNRPSAGTPAQMRPVGRSQKRKPDANLILLSGPQGWPVYQPASSISFYASSHRVAACRLAAEEEGPSSPSRASLEGDASGRAAALTQPQILESLQQAYKADSTGMQFWEAARLHRCLQWTPIWICLTRTGSYLAIDLCQPPWGLGTRRCAFRGLQSA